MKKILIVDHDRSIRELLQLHLSSAGYEALVAEDGDRRGPPEGRAILRPSFSVRTRTSTTSPEGSAPSRFSPSRSMPIACSESSPSAFGQRPRNEAYLGASR